MLWLAIRFASLPLEVYSRSTEGSGPIAVASSAGTGAEVLVCNEAAQSCGIHAGMRIAAAMPLAADLRVLPRDIDAERAALERIAAWAIQYTPTVSIAGSEELLLEVEGSLKFFGGLNSLWSQINVSLGKLGYRFMMAVAPTPLAAQWFVRAGLSLRIRNHDALRVSAGRLPVSVVGTSLKSREAGSKLLEQIGAHTIDDCLKLPRDGTARRLGPQLIDDLDRALGLLPDPRPVYAPPPVFKAKQVLPAPAQQADMLLFAARRLLIELCGYLGAAGKGIQVLHFVLEHEALQPTRITLSLVAATRDADHLINVLREHLDRTRLPCPAVAIHLESGLFIDLAAENHSLIPDAGRHVTAAHRLIERLSARLGMEAVQSVAPAPDHRPELAWRTTRPERKNSPLFSRNYTFRPLWLLREPRPLLEKRSLPCYDGELTLVAGPERIESGWWDERPVMRDYFIAANPAQALLWIYRERQQSGGWYLHGFFG